jgi:hypothetical protein
MKDSLYKNIKDSIEHSDIYIKFCRVNKTKNFLRYLLNFYRIAANKDLYKKFKRDILTEKLIYIDRHLTLPQREGILNKIRFNKFIK